MGSVLSSLRQVLFKEGFVGLFKGNGVQMLRIFPYAAIQFSTFEQYKKFLKPFFSNHPHVNKLVAGSLAGLTAVFVTYPLDVVRSRVAFELEVGMVDTVRAMLYLEGGLRSFYRGIIPSMLGMAPYSGLSFFTYEVIKSFFLEYFPDILGKPCPQNTGGLVLIVPAKLVCGGLAGAVAQTISYPLDVVRRRLQLSSILPEPHKYNRGGWVHTLVMVYRDDGISKGLFRGMTVNYLRIMPMVGVSFTAYETLKQALGLDTGFDR
ncbi:hypothetical protein C0Q70_00564 [Pomacea canaliculata]|uniref:Mitochondrial carrier protein n=1 Tax=Pomacea canaliculata TaxID=400727 RepID=A0A2T7PX13_POMCA|nr:hypothetical protein C0Q70_00564 [Pomacea canaliculata]